MLFLVANSPIIGGFDKLAPQADVSDGLFDVILVKKCSIIELGRLLSLALRGGHLEDPRVIHFKTDQLSIRGNTVSINVDGEFGGTSPCEYQLLKNHLQVLAHS